MPTTITSSADQPIEEATFAVTFASFVDETGAPAVPQSATWTLTDRAGTVINSRNQVVVAAPAATIIVLLSGNDLSIPIGDAGRRALVLEWVYDSSLGNDLPGKDVCYFTITPLEAVT